MATISNAERNAIIDQLLTVCNADPAKAGTILDFLQTGVPAIAWATILRTRAAVWAPFVSGGLSIPAFCDEVVRYAAVYAYGRT